MFGERVILKDGNPETVGEDSMRPGPTPERMLALCRLVENGSYTRSELYKLCALDPDAPSGDEYISRTISSATDELELIKEDENGHYTLEIDSSCLASSAEFRKAVAPRIFALKESRFFKLTEWFVKNSEDSMKINKFDEFASEAAKNGVEDVDENDVLGWRFWMRYLGFAYQYNKTLIPNMKVRIKDALEGVESGTRMTCRQFIAWLKENLPETAVWCDDEYLPLALSNGLRTLEHEGFIEMISTRDAVRVSLYPLRGVERTDFSDIVVKEIS